MEPMMRPPWGCILPINPSRGGCKVSCSGSSCCSKSNLKFARLLPVAYGLLLLCGCGGQFSNGNQVSHSTIASVSVSCSPSAILIAQTSKCTASVQGTGSFNPAFTWSVSGGAITPAGVFTPVGVGTSRITATSVQDSTKSAGTTVTATLSPAITSVAVTCTPTILPVGQTSQCAATVTGAGADNSAVTWSATGGVVNSSGLFTATAGGTATITATSKQDKTQAGWAQVAVTVPASITSVSVICSPASILTTQASACTPTVTGAGNYSAAVRWSVSPTNLGTISSSGVFTPTAPGSAIITATSVQDATQSGSATVTVTNPTAITSLIVSCSRIVVPVSQTSQCHADVLGTGNFSSTVTWTVNGTQGGDAVYGMINPAGLYLAPPATPAAYIVSIRATSTMDPAKSAALSVLVAGPVATATQQISASTGGTVSLPDGSSATIPTGVLSMDSLVTLQLNSTPIEPSSGLAAGIGPSLMISVSPARGSSAAALRMRPSYNPGASPITVVIHGGAGLDIAQLKIAQGVQGTLDATNGQYKYNAVPSTYDLMSNQTTLQVDPSPLEEPNSTMVGLAVWQSNFLNHDDHAWLQVWSLAGESSFSDAPSGYCPTGSRILVVVHGIFSSPQAAFGQASGAAACSLAHTAASSDSCQPSLRIYDAVLGINYQWWMDVDTCARSLATILNNLFANCSYNGTFDIEAHSKGTTVTLASTASMSDSVRSRLKHIVLVAGPIDGTPAADQVTSLLTYGLNQAAGLGDATSAIASILMPLNPSDMYGSLGELGLNSPVIMDSQATALSSVPSAEFILAGGNDPHLLPTFLDQEIFGGEPNDGVIPVRSALPTDSYLPNIVRLKGNAPAIGDYPYPHDHTHLVNDATVVSNILSALAGEGATADVDLSVSARPQSASPGQTVTLTADVTGMLNPHIEWSADGGTLNQFIGQSVQFTIPQTPLASYRVTATLSAVPRSSTVSIAAISDNPIPVITRLGTLSLPAQSTPQTLAIIGTGFTSLSTVTFNSIDHPLTSSSATQLTILLTVADLATAGSYPIVVTNPSPGGGASNAVNFIVTGNNPAPSITTLSPSALPEGAAPQTLTITGTGFLPSSTVTLHGANHTPAFVSATQLTISLASADLATAGSFPVVVTNPPPGGGVSAAINLPVMSVKSIGKWAWMGGANTSYYAPGSDYAAVYGTRGVPDAANHPGPREWASGWAGEDGSFWLFGGMGPDSSGSQWGGLNDLWQYDPSTGAWAWISGTNTLEADCSNGSCRSSSAHYGTQGVPSTANSPGGRMQPVTWVDSKGNLWLFGGQGVDSTGTTAVFNDLWRFNPSTGEWTWIFGNDSPGCSQTPGQGLCGRPAVYGTQGTATATNDPGGRSAAVGWIDSSDNLWLSGGYAAGGSLNDLWKYDLVSGEWTWVNGSYSSSSSDFGVFGTKGVAAAGNVPGGRDNAVSWTDKDGNFWLFGGYGAAASTVGQLNDLWEFSPRTGLWTWVSGSSDLQCPVPLTNGSCFGGYNPATGVYGTMGVPAFANAPGGRYNLVSWTGSDGNLWLFGGEYMNKTSDGTQYSGMFDDLWQFNISTKMWTWMGGSDAVPCPLSSSTYINGCGLLGVYGVKGTAAHTNAPGSRYEAVGWTDKSGNLWLFGGGGGDSEYIGGTLNDLWRYQP